MDPLRMVPVEARWTQQRPCALVMKPTTRLDVARDMGIKTLTLRCNPIYDGTFHSLRVISAGTISTFLDLTGIMIT